MVHVANKEKFYTWGIILFCCAYLILQLFYNYYAGLVVDDFWFAHRIYEYKNGLPYRDFAPYKTVLGYYILLPSMTLVHGLLSPLIFTKDVIALLNTLLFCGISFWLKRFFSLQAIFTALALLLCSEYILSYSTNIRVDFIAYWFCFISVLFLLEKRYFFAGLIIGLGFLTSQKALWYIFASDCALGLYWLLIERTKKVFWGAGIFNATLLLTILIYIGFWAYWTDLTTVLHSVFYEAYVMYQLDWYDSTRKLFWGLTIVNNPFVFLLWPLAIVTLFLTPQYDPNYGKRFFIIIYSGIILFCLIPFKQVFPYYMLTTVPAFFLLYTAFFSWLYEIYNNSFLQYRFIGKDELWGLLCLYLICLLYVCASLAIPSVYALFGIFAILLISYVTQLSDKFSIFKTTSVFKAVVIFGGLFSLLSFLIHLPKVNGRYQKSVLYLTNELLKDGSDYLAGIELIYNKVQPIPGMRHLDAPALGYLYNPLPKLRIAMLPSLYHTPDITQEKALRYLQFSSVKFYVNNYRMHALPVSIKNYLANQYEHFWGSIYLYAPIIQTDQRVVMIKFSGNYQVESEQGNNIKIDGKKIIPLNSIYLTNGVHQMQSQKSYRLKLMPEHVESLLEKKYKHDHWNKMLF